MERGTIHNRNSLLLHLCAKLSTAVPAEPIFLMIPQTDYAIRPPIRVSNRIKKTFEIWQAQRVN